MRLFFPLMALLIALPAHAGPGQVRALGGNTYITDTFDAWDGWACSATSGNGWGLSSGYAILLTNSTGGVLTKTVTSRAGVYRIKASVANTYTGVTCTFSIDEGTPVSCVAPTANGVDATFEQPITAGTHTLTVNASTGDNNVRIAEISFPSP